MKSEIFSLANLAPVCLASAGGLTLRDEDTLRHWLAESTAGNCRPLTRRSRLAGELTLRDGSGEVYPVG